MTTCVGLPGLNKNSTQTFQKPHKNFLLHWKRKINVLFSPLSLCTLTSYIFYLQPSIVFKLVQFAVKTKGSVFQLDVP